MSEPDEDDPLVKAAKRGAERDERGREMEEPSVGRSLAQIGVLGWMIVTPTVIGLLVGRWLDHILDSDMFWTASLLVAGFALGGWSAWKWMQRA